MVRPRHITRPGSPRRLAPRAAAFALLAAMPALGLIGANGQPALAATPDATPAGAAGPLQLPVAAQQADGVVGSGQRALGLLRPAGVQLAPRTAQAAPLAAISTLPA